MVQPRVRCRVLWLHLRQRQRWARQQRPPTAPTPIVATRTTTTTTTPATPAFSDPATQESNSSLAFSKSPTRTTTTIMTATTTAMSWGYVGWGSSIPTTASGSVTAAAEFCEEGKAAAADVTSLVRLVEGTGEENGFRKMFLCI